MLIARIREMLGTESNINTEVLSGPWRFERRREAVIFIDALRRFIKLGGSLHWMEVNDDFSGPAVRILFHFLAYY